MVLLDPEIGQPLTFEEMKCLVEAASPAIELQLDSGGKGRFLVARKALKSGEVVLSEYPLFCGRTDGLQSRRACKEEFASLTKDVESLEQAAEFEDDDCMHPCSPLVDCLSGILLAKSEALRSQDKGDRARSKLKIRKFVALACTSVTEPVSDQAAQDIMDLFTPEVANGFGKDEVREMLRTISSNRFSGLEGQLDLMFAGSMFEHSCEPNCFAGNWRRSASMPRLYRALRDIEVGEALSISYMQLPELYLPTAGRAEVLAPWGFRCSCPRCTSQPEVTRAFVCPACSSSELCPTLMGSEDPGSDVPQLRCLKCEHSPDAAYTRRCFDLEAVLDRLAQGIEEKIPDSGSDANNNVIGSFHHAAFRISWQTMQEGPSPDTLYHYACAIEELIQCVTRLHGDPRNPNLLELYHIMAELETGNLESQQHYLELERATLMAHYPEEAERQDKEIWNLVTKRGPNQVQPEPVNTDLSCMD